MELMIISNYQIISKPSATITPPSLLGFGIGYSPFFWDDVKWLVAMVDDFAWLST